MTLAEIERLVRRIEDAMDRPPANGALARLAGEFQTAARAASARLSQCATLMSAGDEHQALQLAETQPALLDQLTLLAFRRSPQWRSLCAGENLPVPDTFDIRTIRNLNDLYAKGIDKDHALYREYRRAVMLNDDPRALAILRSIARLNPNDANARAELERLEKKQRGEKIRQLEQLIRANESGEKIAELVERLENVPEAARSQQWVPAQIIRAKVLLAQAEQARRGSESGELQRTLQKLAALAHLLDSTERKSLEELEQWSSTDIERRKEAASRRAAIDELAGVTSQLENDEFSTRRRTLLELRRALDSLERAWNRIEHFRAESPADLSRRAEKLRDALRGRVERSLRASRQLAFGAVVVIVAACAAAGWFAYSRQAARALETRLQALIAERRVGETHAALQGANNQLPARARSAAEDFIRRELGLQTAANQSLTNVESFAARGFTNAQPEQIATAFQTARDSANAMAPEFKPPAEAALARTEALWIGFLEEERAARSTRLASLLTPIDAASERELQYSIEADAVAASAQRLQRDLAPARQIASTTVRELQPKQELLFRLESLETRIAKMAREATNFVGAQNSLAAATNLADFNNALQMFASSGFTPAELRTNAAAMLAMNLNATNLIAAALLTNAPISALAEPRASRIPDQALPIERDILARLRDDENVSGISELAVEVKALPPGDANRIRKLFLRGQLERRITRKSGVVYDPRESPGALNFAQKEFGSLDYNVQEPTPSPERELYRRLGLENILDAATGKYQASLLQVLDDINLDRTASALFRAWLFMRICEMIDAQPVQWSAIWTPSLAQDRTNLVRLGALQIRSGDWFVPAKSAAAPRFGSHFNRVTHSYARQAAFFKRLAPQISAQGLTLIPPGSTNRAFGFVSLDQAPQFITDAQRMPLSPLFVPNANVPETIRTTLESLGYNASAVGLPYSLPPGFRP